MGFLPRLVFIEMFLSLDTLLVRTRHGTMDWFKIGKRVRQGYILSPCLCNLHTEYIMQNARLDEAQAVIKIAGRNINNLRYADDTTLITESKEELKSFLMKVRGQCLHHQVISTDRAKCGQADPRTLPAAL